MVLKTMSKIEASMTRKPLFLDMRGTLQKNRHRKSIPKSYRKIKGSGKKDTKRKMYIRPGTC